MTRSAAWLLVVALAGCGGDDATNEQRSRTVGGRATGGGLSIEEALDRNPRGAVLVKGSLLARGGDIRLCSGFRESDPPQCAEPSLRIVGLEVDELEGREDVRLERSAGVTWTSGEVELRGEIRGRALHVAELPG